ncbi:Proteasome activator complex subunit 4 [Toxocara canis]|uniref:Proteasome activator complex subunit 4 n=1 Tax=Toxocara canis TaxID=6265 RepID=A0A0B2V4X4_TOXCA|nr:Proteasome activator complex subunit 4 [Toxocara canis]
MKGAANDAGWSQKLRDEQLRWGVSVDKNTVKMGWHIPQPDELQLAESFIYDVVETELERLEAPHSLDKDEVRKSLYIISSVLTANMNRIPPLKGSVIDLFHSRVPLNAVSYTNSVKGLRRKHRLPSTKLHRRHLIGN